MKNIKTLYKGLKEIYILEKQILPISAFLSILGTSESFINLFFSIKLITLTLEKTFSQIIFVLAVYLILKSSVYLSKQYLTQVQVNKSMVILNNERNNITNIAFNIDYHVYESYEFKDNLQKYFEHVRRSGSVLKRYSYQIYDIFRGFLNIVVSITYLLITLKSINLKNIFNNFDLVILLPIVCILIILIVAIILSVSYINKKRFYLLDKSLKIDKSITYYSNLIIKNEKSKDIRIYNLYNSIKDKLSNIYFVKGNEIRNNISRFAIILGAIIAIIGGIISFFAYSVIGVISIIANFSIQQIIISMGCLTQIVSGIILVVDGFGKINLTIKALPYYFNIMSYKKSRHQTGKLVTNINKIEFQNVSFKYPGSNKYVVKDISLILNKNDKIAVVGKNGAGKSTLIKLLCGFYSDYEGKILINDIDFKLCNKESYFKLLSAVFQNYSTFPFTIAQNISAYESFNINKMDKCTEQSGLKSRISSLGNKYNTYISKDIDDNGIAFSGGEKQKIAFARALYKDSKLVILDEPTSALDPIAEKNLYTKYQAYFDKQITIFISHRLASCSFCDKILVMDNGCIAQYGTQNELLNNKNGLYYKMWNTQAKYYD